MAAAPALARRAMLTPWLWAAVWVAAAMQPAPALALDPQRPLSQALLRVWQAQQGLPRGVIFALRQSAQGYLWLGTQAGLYRFDGVRFVPWQSRTFAGSDRLWVEDLAEDAAGFLWVATDGAGVLRIRRETEDRFDEARGLPSNRVRAVLVDRSGVVWLGTQGGPVRLREGRLVEESVGMEGQPVTALAESPDGRIYLAFAGGRLCCWDGGRLDPVELSSAANRAEIHSLCATPDGSLWIGTSDGLVHRQGASERRLTTGDGLSHNVVHTLFVDAHHSVWAGTKVGLCRIQGDRIESFQSHDGLSQSTVHALCEDSDGDIWVGTKNGLNQFVDRRAIFPFTTAEGLPSNSTGPLLQDAAGTVWVGTLDRGLARFDGRRFESVVTVEQGLPSNRILSLLEDEGGKLWIGTEGGLSAWNGTSVERTWTAADGLPSSTITALAAGADGRLWVGTSGGPGALHAGQIEPLAGPVKGQAVHALVAGGDGSVIASMGEQLYQLQPGRVQPLPDEQQFGRVVNALHRDVEGRLWLTLRGHGLGLIDGSHRHEFGIRDGLFDDDLYGLTSNDRGQLWIGCSRGVFAVDQQELLRATRDDGAKVISVPFSPTDALRTIECQEGVQPSIWRMRDGRIWFSTIRGIIVLSPERVGAPPLAPPKVLIEDVRVNGRDVSREQLRGLSPGENNLELRFTALSLAWPARISFRYRLLGFDRDWVEAGLRREAFYTNLPPGHYHFQVQATTIEGTTALVTDPLELTLLPFFYQTRWFLPIVGLSLVGLVALIYQWRMRQIRTRWQMVIAERNRIARELHDTLIQGFSGVTMQLQALSHRLRPAGEEERLQEIIRDAAGCLSEARRSVAGLRQTPQNQSSLDVAIAETARQLTDDANLTLELKLQRPPRALHPDVAYQLLRIMQEAIANAIKHAHARHLGVQLAASSSRLTLSVVDDGAGFDPSAHLERPVPGHYGMIGIRERAAQINAAVEWRSELHRGTAFVLQWPAAGTTTSSAERQRSLLEA